MKNPVIKLTSVENSDERESAKIDFGATLVVWLLTPKVHLYDMRFYDRALTPNEVKLLSFR